MIVEIQSLRTELITLRKMLRKKNKMVKRYTKEKKERKRGDRIRPRYPKSFCSTKRNDKGRVY